MTDRIAALTARLLLLAAAATALAGCGLRGNLERPEPLWGNPQSDVEEAPVDPDGDEEEDEADGERRPPRSSFDPD